MSKRLCCVVLALAICIAGASSNTLAQGLTGQISGVVTDTGGGVMPGATVTVKNVGTNLTRETVTGPDGAFVITNLLAGTFDLTVSVQGFRPYEQKGIVLGATERLALRTIALEVGGLTEVVSVAAESVKVQTTSGERSATITASQIEDIGLRGRDFMGSLKTLPGVIDTSARDAPGWNSVGEHVDQRPDVVQLLVRRRHQQGHRLELRQLRRAGARLDRRSQGAGVELPGRVRPQLGRDDHRRHQERHARFPRHRGVLQPERGVQHEQLGSAAAVRCRPGGKLRQGAVPVRQHGVDHRRSGADSGHVASTRTATSCSSSSRRTCCRGTIPAPCS